MSDSSKSPHDASRQVQYVVAQPIPNGYTVQGITVPYNSNQAMFNDDVLLDVVPAQKTKVIITDPTATGPVSTVCTSSSPQLFYCTICRKTLVSKVKYKSDMAGTCCGIFLFIICFPWSLLFCCCLPCGGAIAVHKCPECGTQVGAVPAML